MAVHTTALKAQREVPAHLARAIIIALMMAWPLVALLSCLGPQLARAEQSWQPIRAYVADSLNDKYASATKPEAGPFRLLAQSVGLAEPPHAGETLEDVGRNLHVKLSLADTAHKTAGVSIDSLWAEVGPDAFIAQYEAYVTIFDSGSKDYLVALADPTRLNGLAGAAEDAVFAIDSDEGKLVDGCHFDAKTGIAYIPRALIEKDEEFIQLQLLSFIDPAKKPSAQIHWEVKSQLLGVHPPQDEGWVACSGYDALIEIPVAEGAGASRLTLDDIVVRLDGADTPVGLGRGSAAYNAETGMLTLKLPPQAIAGIEISLGESSAGLGEAARALVPSIAWAADGRNLNYYPFGHVRWSEELVEGMTFSYRGKYMYCGATEPEMFEPVANSLYWYTDGKYQGDIATRPWSEILEQGIRTSAENALGARHLITLPGGDQTSDYSFKDREWWSSISGADYHGSTTSGIAGAICMHVSMPSQGPWQTWYDCQISCRVLEVNSEGPRPYVILAFFTHEGSTSIFDNTQGATAIYKFEYQMGNITVVKKSSDANVSEGNQCFSLAGAEYGLYADEGCTELVHSFITGSDGTSETIQLETGTYYLKELKASPGFLIDTEVQTIELRQGQDLRAEMSEVPAAERAEGKLLIRKKDADGLDGPQGDAHLAGAEFSLRYFSNTEGLTTGEPERTLTYTSKRDGSIDVIADTPSSGTRWTIDGKPCLPIGTYEITETKAPAGYLLPAVQERTTVQVLTRTEDQLAVEGWVEQSIAEPVIRGGLELAKLSLETGNSTAQGASTLGGARFSITLTSPQPVIIDGRRYASGELVATITSSWDADRGMYVAKTDKHALPYGSYELREEAVAVGSGLLLNEVWSAQVEIREDRQIVSLTSADDGCANQVIRGDLSFLKKEEASMRALPHVVFRIRSLTTGEWHLAVTDENGSFASSASARPHTHLTNANDAALREDGSIDESLLDPNAGIWFSGKSDIEVPANDNLGALPYDSYEVEELASSANEGLILVNPSLVINRHGHEVSWGTINNAREPEVAIATELLGPAATHNIDAGTSQLQLTDTVYYRGLEVGESYLLQGELHVKEADGSDGGILTDPAGEPVCNTVKLRPHQSSGTCEVSFSIDPAWLEGRTAVAYERLYKGESTADDPIATHTDIASEDQSVHPLRISTKAAGAHGNQSIPAHGAQLIIDQVNYEGLTPGSSYVISGELHRASLTGEDLGLVRTAEGEAIRSRADLSATEANGFTELSFELPDASLYAGEKIVVFERLLSPQGHVIATHEDPADPNQTVSVAGLSTHLTDKADGNQEIARSGTITVNDMLHYQGLAAGKSYRVEGVLHRKDAKSGKDMGPLLDSDGKPITAQAEFIVEESTGSTSVDFSFDATLLKDDSAVAYEKVYLLPASSEKESSGAAAEPELIVAHENINNVSQTVAPEKVSKPAKEDKTSTPTKSGSTHTNSSSSRSLPQTGSATLVTASALILGGVSLLVVLLIRRHKDGPAPLQRRRRRQRYIGSLVPLPSAGARKRW